MTYSLVCLPFLAVAVVLSLVAARRLPPPARRRRWLAIGFAGALVLVLTGVFDSLMVAAGLFGYADGTRLGPTIGLAPIEDFAYPIVTVLLVPAIWTLARRRSPRGGRDED